MSIATIAEAALRVSARTRGVNLVQKLAGTIGHPPSLVRCRTTDGLRLRLDPLSGMDLEVIRTGYYERPVLEVILRHLPPNGVFWDIGANIGVHSLTVKHLRPDVDVVSFEPVPTVMSRLMLHAYENRLLLKTLPIALGSAPGYSEMSLRLTGNTGIASITPWPGGKYETTLTVWVDTGDALIANREAPAPAVIKIDVESYEIEALKGLSRTLEGGEVSVIIFESAPEYLPPLTSFLSGFGFTSSSIDERNFIALR